MTRWQPRSSEPPAMQQPRVWVLEDSPSQGALIARALSPSFDVELFGDSPALVEALSSRRPEVLVLDWHVPEISGVEVLRLARETYDEVTLPVLILTASTNAEEDMLEALQAGANDFVSKPYGEAKLRARVATLARVRLLHERARHAEQQHEQALAREQVIRMELEERAAFEQQLIGIVGHDLRTPISAIMLGAGLLARDSKLGERHADIARRVVSSAQRASRLIADVLDFTAVRLGHGLPMRLADVDLHQVVRDVVAEIQMTHAKRVIALQLAGDPHAFCDADRLAQVVINLVTNALYYSAKDSPVSIALEGDAQQLTLSVSNQGAPIPPALLPTLFAPMQRGADEGPSRGSVGLGLFIVDGIVRTHEGVIDVRSTAEAGTTFLVRWPRSPTSAQRRSMV